MCVCALGCLPSNHNIILFQVQWGDRNGSDGSDSDDALSATADFFEDDSLDDSNSSASGDEVPLTPPSDLYSRYFGTQSGKINPEKVENDGGSRPTSSESPGSTRKARQFVGPSSDMLSPVVCVTHRFDAMVLNRQSAALAKGWQLGGWDYNPDQAFGEYQLDMRLEEEYKISREDESHVPVVSPSRRGGK